MSFQLFFHVWLVCQRLEAMGERPEALFLRQELIAQTANDVTSVLKAVHLRSKLLLSAETRKHFSNIMNVLSRHFSTPPSSGQPRRQLDALIWSLLLKESVHRYHDSVFRLSDYLYESWLMMQTRSFEEILAQPVAFSVFSNTPDYKARLLRTNPPLTREELEEERTSTASPKRYHYSIPTAEIPIARGQEATSTLRSLSQTRFWRLSQKRERAQNSFERFVALHDFFVASPLLPITLQVGTVWKETIPGSVERIKAKRGRFSF